MDPSTEATQKLPKERMFRMKSNSLTIQAQASAESLAITHTQHYHQKLKHSTG
ncbi:MAG: hypothetical protein LBJ16_04360 [Holosporaceae bacterium]|nr:hypothetical protein [Holosporaceae bacterium]